MTLNSTPLDALGVDRTQIIAAYGDIGALAGSRHRAIVLRSVKVCQESPCSSTVTSLGPDVG